MKKTKSLIAADLEQVSEAARFIMSTGLTEDALVMLIAEHTKVGRNSVRSVIRALPKLDKIYIKPTHQDETKS